MTSRPAKKLPFKNKPLPRAPSKALPPKPPVSKPRSNTLNHTTQFRTNRNGNTGFTYTTTYYTTTSTSHPWTSNKSTYTTTYHSTTANGNTTSSTINNNGNRKERSNTMPTKDTYKKALPLAPNVNNMDMKYCYNDHVDLNDNRSGIIKFIGEISVELQGAIWYGIELNSSKGENNGSLKGIKYFKCNENNGTFVQKKTIRWLSSGIETSGIDDLDLESASRFHINQIVKIKNKRGKGQIKFIGTFANELRFGIELLDDMGVHSGIIDGKFYFTCGIYRGIFVPYTDLIHLDYFDEEKSTLHNRSSHRLFNNLSSSLIHQNNNSNNDDDDDSDGSIESDSAESVSSVNTLMTVDDAVFDRIQLNEDETDIAFTQILNKYKNIERTQPRPSKLKMNIDTKQLMNGSGIGILQQLNENQQSTSSFNNLARDALSLDLSQTSEIEDSKEQYTKQTPLTDVGCSVTDDEDDDDDNNNNDYDDIDYDINTPTPITPTPNTPIPLNNNINNNKDSVIIPISPALIQSSTTKQHQQQQGKDKKMSIVVTEIMDNGDDEEKSMRPTAIQTEPTEVEIETEIETETELQEQKSTTLEPVNPKKLNSRALSSLSPLGLSPMDHTQHTSDMLDDEWLFEAEESHLKEIPDSPYDVNTTQREFANTCTIIQLGCNNPHKLFKVLKAMTMKLFLNDMKYRLLSAKSNRIRVKLLNYEGVEEFLFQLGFKLKDNGEKLECPIDQPPLCVLDAAVNVCNDYIQKCSRRRAVIDMIKRYNPSNLQEIVKGTEFEYKPVNEEKANTPIQEEKEEEEQQEQEQEQQQQQQQQEEIVIEEALESLIETRDSALSNNTETLIDDELEGNDDTFELYDIISSITHEDNVDSSARQILLLTYTTFTDNNILFNCLNKRFFDCIGNEKKWHIQTKIVSFIQIWMRQYWNEDWESNIFLLNLLEDWFKEIQNKYNNNDKYKKLIDMLVKTMQFQRANKRNQSISQNNPFEWGMLPIKQEKTITEKQFDATYDFFKLNNTKIARQITHMDMTYFSCIKPREMIGQAWKKKNKHEIAKNICALIDHFNRIAKWVQSRVLLAKDAKKRARIIKKFIKICDQLFSLRNFQSLYAIYGALYSSAVIRLKKAWHYVPTKHLAKFEEFKVIFATKRNMANLRKLHRETYPPMIPYTGIFLQDLLSIEEGNSKKKKDGSVNFSRLLRLSTVIDSILLYQKTQYKINPDKKLQSLIKIELQLNQNLSEEHIWKLSDKVHKQDQKKSNFIQMFGAK